MVPRTMRSAHLAAELQGIDTLGFRMERMSEGQTVKEGFMELVAVSLPVFLPGESQGQGSLVGCCLWGCTESDTTEAT